MALAISEGTKLIVFGTSNIASALMLEAWADARSTAATASCACYSLPGCTRLSYDFTEQHKGGNSSREKLTKQCAMWHRLGHLMLKEGEQSKRAG